MLQMTGKRIEDARSIVIDRLQKVRMEIVAVS